MNGLKMLGIALLIVGALGLAYGGFSYTKDTTAMKVGPLEVSVKERKTVNVPMWAGTGALVIGGILFALGSKKR